MFESPERNEDVCLKVWPKFSISVFALQVKGKIIDRMMTSKMQFLLSDLE